MIENCFVKIICIAQKSSREGGKIRLQRIFFLGTIPMHEILSRHEHLLTLSMVNHVMLVGRVFLLVVLLLMSTMTNHHLVLALTLSLLFLTQGRINLNVHGFRPSSLHSLSFSSKRRFLGCHHNHDRRQSKHVGLAAFLPRGASSSRYIIFTEKRDSRNYWNLIKSCSSSNTAMIPLRSSSSDSIDDHIKTPGISDDIKSAKKSKRILLFWVHLLSIFIATNYFRSTLFPSFLHSIPLKIWSLIHALGAMAFSGGIITTTLLEWNLPRLIAKSGLANANTPNNKNSVIELLRWLFRIESSLVLPGVTLTLFSGVVQSHQTYGTFRHAPRHVKSALHLMLVFAVWWVIMDRRSQKSLLGNEYYGDGDDNLFASSSSDVTSGAYYEEDKIVARRLANIVSCLFLVILYGIMILKPGLA